MKPLPVFLALLFFLAGSALTAEQLIVPIVVDIRHSAPNMPVINNEEMSLVKAMAELSKSSQKFGTNDPVIIRLESNADIFEAANLARQITGLYDHVFIALIRDDASSSTPLLLSIGRDVPSVDIKPLFPTLTMRPTRADLQPNRARDQQVQSLRSYQPGETK